MAAVGMVGLGQMGAAMAANLVDAGFEVVGTDLLPERRAAAESTGVRTVDSPAEVAAAADRVVTSLPSARALDDVVGGDGGLVSAGRAGLVVIETSTLPLDVKERNRATAADGDVVLLDCPLSGTGAQARTRDLVVYASGDARGGVLQRGVRRLRAAALRAGRVRQRLEDEVPGQPAGDHPQRRRRRGDGARDEGRARPLADPRGDLVGCRHLPDVRGPRARDGGRRLRHARDHRRGLPEGRAHHRGVRPVAACPLPVFAQSAEIHVAAVAMGHGQHDTASVCAAAGREQLAVTRAPTPRRRTIMSPLPVGATAPDFTLRRTFEDSVTLSDVTARGPVALVFYVFDFGAV
jgi:L-threonate 2-dehydrogenase